MIPADIIAKALLDTHTDSVNYDPETLGLEALNIVNNEINNQIVSSVKEDYFWDEFTMDSVIGQAEYNITEGTTSRDGSSTTVNIKKINKVFIKYTSSANYYTLSRYQIPGELSKDLDEYANTQPNTDPFFYIQDRSFFLYPAPEAVVTDGIKINAIYTPPEIAYLSPETFMAIQPDKHYVYALGIEWQIYKSQGKINEAENARARFEKEMIDLTNFLKARTTLPVKKTITNLDNYR